MLCDGRHVVASTRVPITIDTPHSGWSEQDPADWMGALHTAMERLLPSTNDENAVIDCIGLSGQMHGAVLLDRRLEVLRPCILWNDNRSMAECEALARRVPGIGHLAGVPPLPGFTAPKLMWIAQEEPEIHDRIAHILLPKDYLGLFLHGNLVTDTSDAAGTLWLNQRERSWSQELCEASSTSLEWLPSILDGHQIAGRLQKSAARSLGLKAGIPVVAGGGDAATGGVAVGATESGSGFVSLGTSGQLFVATGDYLPNPEKFVHAFAHTIPDRWYQMAAMLNGARPLSWIADVFGCGVEEVIAGAARAGEDRVPIFLPYLTGERSPHGDPRIRGAFYGLEDATDRDAICRAVVEAVAFSFADSAASFGDRFQDVHELLAVGGGTQSDLLLQFVSNAIGKRVVKASGAEGGPALGAALLAGAGTGAVNISELSVQPEKTAEFDPAPNAVMEDRLKKFRALYAALKDKL